MPKKKFNSASQETKITHYLTKKNAYSPVCLLRIKYGNCTQRAVYISLPLIESPRKKTNTVTICIVSWVLHNTATQIQANSLEICGDSILGGSGFCFVLFSCIKWWQWLCLASIPFFALFGYISCYMRIKRLLSMKIISPLYVVVSFIVK